MIRFLNERPVLRTWVIIVAFTTLFGLINAGFNISENMAYQEPLELKANLIHEMTGSYTVLPLLPLLFWFFRTFPLRKRKILPLIPIYLLASVLTGICHTTLMTVSRNILYKIFGMGTYNPGHLFYRYLGEYNKQFIMFLTILMIWILIEIFKENQERMIHTARLEEKLTKARLQALRMQLNPHFLFNTLNMISSTMYEDVKSADTMLANLSDLMRITLNRPPKEEYLLEEELEILDLYFKIMKARFKDRFTVALEIDPPTRKALIPSFILQPIVENAIRYGMEKSRTLMIRISSLKKDNRIHLAVIDNGPGITSSQESMTQKGVGLSNTSERLENLYGKDHRFEMKNIPQGGLEVRIEIPFRTNTPKH